MLLIIYDYNLNSAAGEFCSLWPCSITSFTTFARFDAFDEYFVNKPCVQSAQLLHLRCELALSNICPGSTCLLIFKAGSTTVFERSQIAQGIECFLTQWFLKAFIQAIAGVMGIIAFWLG